MVLEETAKEIAGRLVETEKYYSIEVCQQTNAKCHPFFVWLEVNGRERGIWEKIGESEYRSVRMKDLGVEEKNIYNVENEMWKLLPHMFTRLWDAIFSIDGKRTVGFKGIVEKGYAYGLE